jgi:hypothetical protein
LKPKTLSASALHVAENCLARYHAEHGLYGKSVSGDAALLGSSVHGALEWYVIKCYIEKVNQPSLDLLVAAYQASFMKTFGTSDMDSPEFQDGLEMIRRWHKRTEFEGFEVLSCEVKENFEVPFPDKTTVQLNYIFDRLDKTGPNSYRVVDYKSQRWALNPQDLDTKIQARIYALAVQIKYPEAEEIWVVFDDSIRSACGSASKTTKIPGAGLSAQLLGFMSSSSTHWIRGSLRRLTQNASGVFAR